MVYEQREVTVVSNAGVSTGGVQFVLRVSRHRSQLRHTSYSRHSCIVSMFKSWTYLVLQIISNGYRTD